MLLPKVVSIQEIVWAVLYMYHTYIMYHRCKCTYEHIQPQSDLERHLSEYPLQLDKTADVLNCPGNQVMMLCPLQLRMSGSHRNIVGPDDCLHIPVLLQKENDKMYAQFKNYIIMLFV